MGGLVPRSMDLDSGDGTAGVMLGVFLQECSSCSWQSAKVMLLLDVLRAEGDFWRPLQ